MKPRPAREFRRLPALRIRGRGHGRCGSPDEDAALGEIVGRSLPGDEVAPAIERVLKAYLEIRQPGERFIDTVRRLGAQAFTSAIYETA